MKKSKKKILTVNINEERGFFKILDKESPYSIGSYDKYDFYNLKTIHWTRECFLKNFYVEKIFSNENYHKYSMSEISKMLINAEETFSKTYSNIQFKQISGYDYDDRYVYFYTFIGEREETDEEYNKRIYKEKKELEQAEEIRKKKDQENEEKEKKEYLRLKKKYENCSNDRKTSKT